LILTYRSHLKGNEHEPTELDDEEWLEGLTPGIARVMAAKGFGGCLSVLSFTRYVQGKNFLGRRSTCAA